MNENKKIKELMLSRSTKDGALYLGAYLDNVRMGIAKEDKEEVCYTLAQSPDCILDETLFNSDQRMRLFEWFEENPTPAIEAALYQFYQVQLNATDPAQEAECTKFSERIVYVKEKILKTTDIEMITDILNIIPQFASEFSDIINGFMDNCNPFSDYRLLRALLYGSYKKEWNLKNKKLNALKKLNTSSVSEGSAACISLQQYFTKREICFLNYHLYDESSKNISDKITVTFITSLIRTANAESIREEERVIIRCEKRREFTRRIQGFKYLSELFTSPQGIVRLPEKEAIVKAEDWNVFYSELLGNRENRTILWNGYYLYFDILRKENQAKWDLLTDSDKVGGIKNLICSLNDEINSFYHTGKYAEENQELVRKIFALLCNTWNDQIKAQGIYRVMRDKFRDGKLIYAFGQNGLLEIPTTDEFYTCLGKFLYCEKCPWRVKLYLDYWKETGTLLEGDFNHVYKNKELLSQLTTRDQMDLFRLIYDSVIYHNLGEIRTFLGSFMDQDWKWKQVMPENEAVVFARFLLESNLFFRYEAFLQSQTLTEAEYEAWQQDQKMKKEEEKAFEELLEFQSDLTSMVRGFARKSKDFSWMGYRLREPEALSIVKPVALKLVSLHEYPKLTEYVEVMHSLSSQLHDEAILFDMAKHILTVKGE